MGAGMQGGGNSLFAKALMELRSLILCGGLAPGDRVSEVTVSRRLGISRTPLREAMARLTEEGLLERLPRGGCRVRGFSRAEVVDAIELRGVLEGAAARIAAERGADPARMEEARRVLDAIDDALGADQAQSDFARYAALNEEFHHRVAGLSGSGALERELARVAALPLAGPSAFLQRQADVPEIRRSLFRAQGHHRAILEAIAAREGARAEALGREHARLSLENFDHVLFAERSLADSIPGLPLVSRDADEAGAAPAGARSRETHQGG